MSDMGGSDFGGGDLGGGDAGGDVGGGDLGGDDVSASDFGEVSDGGDLGSDSGGSDVYDPIAEAPVMVDAGSWGEDDSSVDVPDNLQVEVPDDPPVEVPDNAPVEVPDYSGIEAPDDASIDSSIVTAQADQAPFVEQPIPSDVTQIPDGTLSPIFNDNAEDTRRIDQFRENADDITHVPDDGESGDGTEDPSLDYTPPGPGGLG